MNHIPENQSRKSLAHLIQDLEEGVISVSDRELLMEMLRSNKAARRQYLRHFAMVALLQETAKSRAEVGGIPVSQQTLVEQKRRSAFTTLTWGMAAVLTIGLGFLLMRPSIRQQIAPLGPVAVKASNDAAYSIAYAGRGPRNNGRMAPGDRLSVSHGTVQMTCPSGVEVLVEGPADIEIVQVQEMRMLRGSCWFRVPEEGRGFAVITDRARVVDHGTEFGMRFDLGGALEVHVAEGLVTAKSRTVDGQEFELTAGKAVEFDFNGVGSPIPAVLDHFNRDFTRDAAYIHWSFDNVEDGRFTADGLLATSSAHRPAIRRSGQDVSGDAGSHLTEGMFGAALSLAGDGTFAEANFPAMGLDAPRTIAAWVRYHSSESNAPRARGVRRDKGLAKLGQGTRTPAGEQAYAILHKNAAIATRPETIDAVLQPGMSYTLEYRVGVLVGESQGEYCIELLVHDPSAKNQQGLFGKKLNKRQILVANRSKGVAKQHLGHQGCLTFKVPAGDSRIGWPLGIRLQGGEGQIMFDDLRLSVSDGSKESRVLFAESFESPRVEGFHRSTLPDSGWVGANRSDGYGCFMRGLYNEQPHGFVPFFVCSGDDSQVMRFLYLHEGRWCVASGSSSYATPVQAQQIGVGEWTHVATVYTGRRAADGHPEIHHYINGVRQYGVSQHALGEVGLSPDENAGEAVIHFGSMPHAAGFDSTLNGAIDEVYVIRGVLGPAEIKTLMEENRLVLE